MKRAANRQRRRRSAIAGAFVAHTKDMRESYAWRHLPDNARRLLDRLEIEHMRHAGAENGRLICTYADLAEHGIRRASVPLAIRQCVELGFLRISGQGQRSISSFRAPSLYVLTYLGGCGDSPVPTNDWLRIKSDTDAAAALLRAAALRNLGTQPRKRTSKAPSEIQKAGRENATATDAFSRLHEATI